MQIAILLIRLASLSWFIEGLLLVTYFPVDAVGVSHYQSGYLASQYKLEIVMKTFRILFHVGIGLFFLIRAESMARLFTKGLERFSTQPQSEAWPPAPRSEIEHPVTKPTEPAI